MHESNGRRSDVEVIAASYDLWAPVYIERFAAASKADVEDRDLIRTWAAALQGPVLDAGCGPGHWSAFLRSLGVSVEGVDATPGFIAHARRTHPGIDFRLADLRDLELAEHSLGGVLAWFSLIHADPTEVPDLLGAFARALRPGGRLLLGFFSGPRLEPFDHRVVTAWAWPAADMIRAAETAGLEVLDRHERAAPNGRVNAAVVAERPR